MATDRPPFPKIARRLLAALASLAATTANHAFEPEEDGIYAVFDTSLGAFTAKLAYDGVPLTTANFIGLAEGKIPSFDPETGEAITTGPFYDGLIFHRVIDGFAIQSGDPDPDDSDINGPGYTIPDEMHPNLSHTIPYVISMANGYRGDLEQAGQFWNIGENSGGSQFFITLEPPPNQPGPGSLDGHYSVFGVIEDGIDVIEAIGDVPVDPATARPTTDVVLRKVTIIRHGEDAQAWSLQDYELPFQNDFEVELDHAHTATALTISPDWGRQIQLQESPDLQTWSDQNIQLADGESSATIELAPGHSKFLRLKELDRPHDYQEHIPGSTLVVEMANHPLSSEPWTFSFNDNIDDLEREDAFGTVSIPGLPDALINRYQYHRLPNGARLRVQTESYQIMTFYLRFTSQTSGGLLAWVDSYLHGNSANEPLRFPTTGTFTLATP